MTISSWSRATGVLSGRVGSALQNTYLTVTGLDKGTNVSHSNRDYYRRLGHGDAGNDWLLTRDVTKFSSVDVDYSSFGVKTRGTVGPASFGTFFSPSSLPPSSDQELAPYGATAIARTIPANPQAQLSTFVGELVTEGGRLPELVGRNFHKEQVDFLRGSGSEYLNVEYGWLPLVSDLKAFAHSVKNHGKILKSFRKTYNRPVRAAFAFPSESGIRTGSGKVALVPSGMNAVANVQLSETATTERWFAGSFLTHVPTGDDFASKLARWDIEADKLLGVNLTPETLWNIAPWSWGVDWFSNVGDVMHNISYLGPDATTLLYGYMMEHRRVDLTGYFTWTGGGRQYTFYGSRVIESKKRVHANPYGFGVTDTSLSPKQLAILAAIGITRTRKPGVLKPDSLLP